MSAIGAETEIDWKAYFAGEDKLADEELEQKAKLVKMETQRISDGVDLQKAQTEKKMAFNLNLISNYLQFSEEIQKLTIKEKAKYQSFLDGLKELIPFLSLKENES